MMDDITCKTILLIIDHNQGWNLATQIVGAQ